MYKLALLKNGYNEAQKPYTYTGSTMGSSGSLVGSWGPF